MCPLSFFGTNNLTGSTQPASIASKSVSPSYFAVLGVDAALGPHLRSARRHARLQHRDCHQRWSLETRIWRRPAHYQARLCALTNDIYHVGGVMPAGFRDQGQTSEERNTDVWRGVRILRRPPLRRRCAARASPSRPSRAFAPVSRLTPRRDASIALVASLKKQYPADYPAQGAWDTPYHSPGRDSCRQCSPIADSALRRGGPGLADQPASTSPICCLLGASARGREMAVRQALGAARTRLIRQLFTESLLLFVLGGINRLCGSLLRPGNFFCNLFPKACRASITSPLAGACWRLPSSSPSLPEPSSGLPRRGSPAASI